MEPPLQGDLMSTATVTRLPVVWLALACVPCGCTSWHVEEAAPQLLRGQDQPDKMRITLTTGETLIVAEPRLVADTLTGRTRADVVRLSVSQIRQWERRGTDWGSTVVLGIGGMLLAGLAALAAVASRAGF
jgi:hypothetical protein